MNQQIPNGYQPYYPPNYLPAPPFVSGANTRAMVLL